MTFKIPILMYHALLGSKSEGVHGVHILRSEFEKQMQYLHEEGYQVLPLDEIVDLFVSPKPHPPQKAVGITFDDGYLSLLEHATPILSKLGYPSTLFLTVGAVGLNSYNEMKGFSVSSVPNNDRPLNWDELNEMQTKGWSIESHGINHHSLPSLSNAERSIEFEKSLEILRNRLNNLPKYFAYPFGHYNSKSIKGLSKHYKAGFAVHNGLADNREDIFRIRRVEINQNDTMESFAKKLSIGYASDSEAQKASIKDLILKNSFIKDLILHTIGYR